MARLNDQTEILKGCLDIIEILVSEFEAYLDLKGIDPSDQDGEGSFGVTIPTQEIAKKLFLSGEGMDLEVKTQYLSRLLDISKSDVVNISFEGVKCNGGSEN